MDGEGYIGGIEESCIEDGETVGHREMVGKTLDLWKLGKEKYMGSARRARR